MRRPLSRALPAAVLALAARPALAHRIDFDLRLLGGERALIEVFFSDGAPAEGAEVVVRRADGSELARGRTDARGGFEFAAPEGGALDVEVRHGAGHRERRTVEPGRGAAPGAPPPPARGAYPYAGIIAGVLVIAGVAALARSFLRRTRAPRD